MLEHLSFIRTRNSNLRIHPALQLEKNTQVNKITRVTGELLKPKVLNVDYAPPIVYTFGTPSN